MNEQQIAQQAHAYINQTYWKSPEAKAIAEDLVLGFLDFMFDGEETCSDCELGSCEPHYIPQNTYIIKGENK